MTGNSLSSRMLILQCPHDGSVYMLIEFQNSDVFQSLLLLNQIVIFKSKLIHRAKHLPIRSLCKSYFLIFLHDPVYHLKPESLILQIVTEVDKKLLLYVLQVSLRTLGIRKVYRDFSLVNRRHFLLSILSRLAYQFPSPSVVWRILSGSVIGTSSSLRSFRVQWMILMIFFFSLKSVLGVLLQTFGHSS